MQGGGNAADGGSEWRGCGDGDDVLFLAARMCGVDGDGGAGLVVWRYVEAR